MTARSIKLMTLSADSLPEVLVRAEVVAGPRNPAAGAIGGTNAEALATRHASTTTVAAMTCFNSIIMLGARLQTVVMFVAGQRGGEAGEDHQRIPQ